MNRGRALEWLPALFVALLAFAFHMQSLETVRHNFDRGYPHGLGMAIREAIAQGRLDQLPAVSLVASINFPNPAGASYFYALLTAIEPGAFAATALNAMLGAVVAVIAYDMARRLFGPWAGVAAGVLAGASLWAAWVARGAWLQGPIAFMAALTFWLLVNGFLHRKPRHLFAAFAGVALFMHTYLVAFGLLAMAVAAAGAGVLSSRKGIAPTPAPLGRGEMRAIIAGLALCAFSALLYVGATISARASVESVINNPNAFNEETRAGGLNLDPINHAFRMASGRDFENTFVLPDSANFAQRNAISDGRATLIDVLLLIGFALALVLAFSTAAPAQHAISSRMLLLWLLLPVIGTLFIGNLVMRDWKVHVFYILLASPAPYVLAGAPFGLLQRGLARRSPAAQRGFAAAGAVLLAGAVLINQWNFSGDVEATQRQPVNYTGLDGLPLQAQMQMAQQARANCVAINNPQERLWLASVFGNVDLVHAGSYQNKNNSTMWSVQPRGGNCLFQIEGPTPSNADAAPMAVGGEPPAVVHTLRSRDLTGGLGDAKYTTNIGWTLLDLRSPPSVKAGETLTVTHVWRVDSLPNEPFASWYYAPFVKLFAPDGRQVMNVDSAPALEGWAWRPGEWLVSDVRFALPADVPAGDYTLELSLFDPNQKKNAVYFDPADPVTPIVVLRRPLTISSQ
jgi:4-amino-4-deoxy-L-arabinose transferase-like glycosyltransferase